MAVDSGGREVLLELRERHREIFDCYGSLVGLQIRVRKEGSARNSPVTIKVLGTEAAMERDISRLVDSLGLEAVRMRRPEREGRQGEERCEVDERELVFEDGDR